MSAITDPAVMVFFCHLSVNPSDASIPVDTGTLPVAVDVHMLGRTNIRTVSIGRIHNTPFVPGLCTNTQISFAVFRDATMEHAASAMVDEQISDTHMATVRLLAQDDDSSSTIYFTHVPSVARRAETHFPVDPCTVLTNTFLDLNSRLLSSLQRAVNTEEIGNNNVNDECYHYLFYQICNWYLNDKQGQLSDIKIPDYLVEASWCLKAIYVFQNYYSDLRVSLVDGQHRMTFYLSKVASLQAKWNKSPPFGMAVMPRSITSGSTDYALPLITLHAIILSPHPNEDIAEFNDRCFKEARDTDLRSSSAVHREPVHE